MVQAGAVPVHLDLRPKRLDVAGRCIRLLRRPGRLRLLLRDQAGCPLGADGPPLIALSQHLFDGFLGALEVGVVVHVLPVGQRNH